MKKIAVLFSNGTEEIEGLTPVDVLRRAGAICDIVSISGEYPVGSHQITVKADKLIEETNLEDYDCIIIPGGMPGAKYISVCEKAICGIKNALQGNKVVGAICASPAVVLATHNLIGAKKVTCYPAKDFVDALGDNYTGNSVEVDGNLVTANGPKSAMDFSLAICKALGLDAKF